MLKILDEFGVWAKQMLADGSVTLRCAATYLGQPPTQLAERPLRGGSTLMGAGPSRRFRLFGEQKGDSRKGKNNADDGEGIAEAHDQRLALDDLAKRDDGFLGGDGLIGDAMRHEIAGHLVEAVAHLVARQASPTGR